MLLSVLVKNLSAFLGSLEIAFAVIFTFIDMLSNVSTMLLFQWVQLLYRSYDQ
uniref:Uncharacterized protein n=1 Tax=Rhizophagus irregularis (strain DAOM 181602 / DAOM 197198 / MUCL 43194) TaxID=747089 RepID=U9THD5_RHIID